MRAIWSGSLSFGLINIPVKLYSASKERALKFTLLDKHGLSPVSYMRVHRGDNKEVPYEDIVRGYEYKKGDYVVLTDDDFKNASPRETQTIDILNFTNKEEIDPIYYDKPYYLEPDSKSEKAYVLLREALKRSGKVGVAKLVMRGKEHLAIVMADEKALILNQLRFDDEVRSLKDLNIPTPKKSDYSKKELDVALALIGHLQKHFKASQYEDTYAEKLEKVIASKAKGRKTVKISASDRAPKDTQMSDMMALLKKSLEREKVR